LTIFQPKSLFRKPLSETHIKFKIERNKKTRFLFLAKKQLSFCQAELLGVVVAHCYDNWLRTGRYRVRSLTWGKSLTPGFALIIIMSLR